MRLVNSGNLEYLNTSNELRHGSEIRFLEFPDLNLIRKDPGSIPLVHLANGTGSSELTSNVQIEPFVDSWKDICRCLAVIEDLMRKISFIFLLAVIMRQSRCIDLFNRGRELK